MRILFFIILYMISFTVFSQTVTGYVFDENSKEPLVGAAVYFDGTTIGAITNKEGYFKLEFEKIGTVPLVVSFIGYKNKIFPVNTAIKEYRIYLSPNNEVLNEVVLTADPFSRAQKLRAFRTQFLLSLIHI